MRNNTLPKHFWQPAHPPHPNTETLRQWLDGQLSVYAAYTLQVHVLSCHDCLLQLSKLPPYSPPSWLTATDQWGSTLSLAVVGTEPFAQRIIDTLKAHGWSVTPDDSLPAWAARSADHRCIIGLTTQIGQLSYAFISLLSSLTTLPRRTRYAEPSPENASSATIESEPGTGNGQDSKELKSTTPHIGRAA